MNVDVTVRPSTRRPGYWFWGVRVGGDDLGAGYANSESEAHEKVKGCVDAHL